ncbi:type II toxin-antitoxin system Phd/YefM family antitoxin [Leptolyngbya sp. AN03gr2]|uniref:type II toxin-antitoxin system Phd/YefM family antitoxin n=1 Tax=unclassified Leptolyngbya TaxID=2650499 RepID=UPI003D324611
MPKRLTIVEAQEQLPNLPNELTDEPIIITQNDQPVITLMSYERLISLLETVDILSDREFANKLQQSILEAERGETISWAEVQKRLLED